MIEKIKNFISGYQTKIIMALAGIIITICALSLIVWLWNSRIYYKELVASRNEVIQNLNEEMTKKQQALVKLEEIQNKTVKEREKFKKQLNEVRNEINNTWLNTTIPDDIIKLLHN